MADNANTVVVYHYFDLDNRKLYSDMTTLLKDVRRQNWAVPQLCGHIQTCTLTAHRIVLVLYSLQPIDTQAALTLYNQSIGHKSYGGAPC